MAKKAKFVIFGQGRSGSTLLVDLLNSHPKIRCEGEIFSPESWNKGLRQYFLKPVQKYPYAYLNYKTVNAGDQIYGFKILDHQLPKINNFLRGLSQSGWTIIHIHRKNMFNMAVSNIIASKTNKWSTNHQDRPPNTSIHIDKYNFCDIISWTNACENRIQMSLDGIAHHTVTYEDDLEDEKNWAKTMDRLFNILKVDSMPVSSKYRKTDSRPLSGRITNYDELVSIAISLGLKVD